MTLIQALKTTFPCVQFVVTTHSPMVLPGLKKDEILRVGLNEQGSVVVEEVDESPAVMTGSELYGNIFGINRLYPEDVGKALRDYGYLTSEIPTGPTTKTQGCTNSAFSREERGVAGVGARRPRVTRMIRLDRGPEPEALRPDQGGRTPPGGNNRGRSTADVRRDWQTLFGCPPATLHRSPLQMLLLRVQGTEGAITTSSTSAEGRGRPGTGVHRQVRLLVAGMDLGESPVLVCALQPISQTGAIPVGSRQRPPRRWQGASGPRGPTPDRPVRRRSDRSHPIPALTLQWARSLEAHPERRQREGPVDDRSGRTR